MKIRRGDKVVVTTGRDKGKEGRVLEIDKKTQRVLVEGANMVKRHTKANQKNPQGGIVEKPATLHVSNVAYLHKGKPTKIGYKIEMVTIKDKQKRMKRRVAKSTGEMID
jgi:large subunit ribosomal protein L24